jgi:SPP1 gp7 family putative phage head morphogenesis protein
MTKPTLHIGFDVPFDEAIKWGKERISVLPDVYYDTLPAQARSRAFTVSGLASLDQIQGVLDSLNRAMEQGDTFADWKKTLSKEALALGPARLDNIFRTAVQTNYNIGRYQQQQENKAHRPYLMYDAINDGRTRPHHRALDNFIAPIDDPAWKKIYPPNGFRCRCGTLSLTEAQAKQRGYQIGNQPQGHADAGWDYNPAIGQDAALNKLVENRLGVCGAYDFAGRRSANPIWCAVKKAGDFLRGLFIRADNASMKTSFDFMGQRPGLRDLPPIPIIELTGEEFGRGMSHRELVAAANEKLRSLQGGTGLPNDDTGWNLRINKNGRKKIGDNEEQSDAELKAVAGISGLAKHAVVAESHLDLEHHNEFVRAVYRIYAPLSLDGQVYRVKLTVKDYIGTADKKDLHALAAVEIEDAPLGTLPTSSAEALVQSGQPTTGRTMNIADLLKNATRNDGGLYDL